MVFIIVDYLVLPLASQHEAVQATLLVLRLASSLLNPQYYQGCGLSGTIAKSSFINHSQRKVANTLVLLSCLVNKFKIKFNAPHPLAKLGEGRETIAAVN